MLTVLMAATAVSLAVTIWRRPREKVETNMTPPRLRHGFFVE